VIQAILEKPDEQSAMTPAAAALAQRTR
jgi:hypothetical protein